MGYSLRCSVIIKGIITYRIGVEMRSSCGAPCCSICGDGTEGMVEADLFTCSAMEFLSCCVLWVGTVAVDWEEAL